MENFDEMLDDCGDCKPLLIEALKALEFIIHVERFGGINEYDHVDIIAERTLESIKKKFHVKTKKINRRRDT